ncbi:hypothetical protein [Bradyrhizobium sp. SZCCHNS2096]|uniref:hypothetical protein n=1 Tax=Bradyrhizobium sp. SZCCHNS2096 TaxID=3057309 RepID=UPI002916CC3B|nr:hypothetical protein [Bradyrhizobium sp. SZCCHNS2096]
MSVKVIEKIEDIKIRDHEQIRLKYLRLSLDMGCCKGLRWKLTEWGDFLSRSKDTAVLTEYEEIKGKAEAMYAIEDAHGDGSLLNLDHPNVQSLSQQKNPPWSAKEIAAARTFRSQYLGLVRVRIKSSRDENSSCD